MKLMQHSETIPGDAVSAPLAVTIHEHAPKCYVTHIKNMQQDDLFWGHYHLSWDEAMADYHDRLYRFLGRH